MAKNAPLTCCYPQEFFFNAHSHTSCTGWPDVRGVGAWVTGANRAQLRNHVSVGGNVMRLKIIYNTLYLVYLSSSYYLKENLMNVFQAVCQGAYGVPGTQFTWHQ